MGAGGARGPRGPGARRPAARERRAGAGEGGRPELGAAGWARGSGREPRTIGGRAPRPAAEPRRPRGSGRPGAAQGHAARAAGPGPGQRPSARLQVRGPGRIVSPSGPAHCAAEAGGRAGAHLPSAAAALIGVLPAQLRPGPRAPGRDPNSGGRRAGRSPARVLRGPAAAARPGRPSRWEWESARATHGAGQRLSLLPASARNVCDTALPRGREREAADGPERRARPGIPHRQRARPAAPGEEGAHRLLLAGGLSGSWVRPSRRPVPHLLCERLRSAIFFLPLVGPLSRPRGPIGTDPCPCLPGKFLGPQRRVRQARGPGGSRSSQGRCLASPGPPGWPRGGAWRWQESGPSSGRGGGGVGAVM